MSSCGPTGRRFNDSPLPSPIVAVTSKKSQTKRGSLMLYRILHWLPVLPGSLTIVPSTIRITRVVASSSRYARADVEELADPGFTEKPHRPAEEGAVGPGDRPDGRFDRRERPAHVLVGQEVVAAAEQVVIDPGDVRPPGVDSRRYPVRLASRHACLLALPPGGRAASHRRRRPGRTARERLAGSMRRP